MAKLLFILIAMQLLLISTYALNYGECPLSSQISVCTPKCLQDIDCSAMGGLCCPNICNTKSCARPKAGSQGSVGGKYKGSSVSSATGIYCGNEKCSANQICAMDKSTKRQKCTRP